MRAQWVREQGLGGGRGGDLWLKDGWKEKKNGRRKSPDSLSSFNGPINGSGGGEERLGTWSSTQTRIKGNPHLIQVLFECFMVRH